MTTEFWHSHLVREDKFFIANCKFSVTSDRSFFLEKLRVFCFQTLHLPFGQLLNLGLQPKPLLSTVKKPFLTNLDSFPKLIEILWSNLTDRWLTAFFWLFGAKEKAKRKASVGVTFGKLDFFEQKLIKSKSTKYLMELLERNRMTNCEWFTKNIIY